MEEVRDLTVRFNTKEVYIADLKMETKNGVVFRS